MKSNKKQTVSQKDLEAQIMANADAIRKAGYAVVDRRVKKFIKKRMKALDLIFKTYHTEVPIYDGEKEPAAFSLEHPKAPNTYGDVKKAILGAIESFDRPFTSRDVLVEVRKSFKDVSQPSISTALRRTKAFIKVVKREGRTIFYEKIKLG